MKNKKLVPILLAFAAAGIYRAAKGRGAFNPIRFADQHDAVSRYIQAHYPNAAYSPINQTAGGWSCVIHASGREVLLLISRAENGVYIFHERPL